MLPQGTFQCAVCNERRHLSKKEDAYRSYFPERKIAVCVDCIHDYRTIPEYAHLRPNTDPTDKLKIEKIREYYKDTHIFF